VAFKPQPLSQISGGMVIRYLPKSAYLSLGYEACIFVLKQATAAFEQLP
jgi:hypothetical protein